MSCVSVSVPSNNEWNSQAPSEAQARSDTGHRAAQACTSIAGLDTVQVAANEHRQPVDRLGVSFGYRYAFCVHGLANTDRDTPNASAS